MIQRLCPPEGRLVLYEDNIIDGRVPIEVMQSNAIKHTLAALDPSSVRPNLYKFQLENFVWYNYYLLKSSRITAETRGCYP